MPTTTTTPAFIASSFDDEFTSFQPSQTGWSTELPFWGSEHTLSGNHEAEYYVDSSQPNSPFSLSNGVLTIQASEVSTTGANPLGLPYNSGALTTYNSLSQLYGYFEIRAELPAGTGLWPAFWLMPTSFKPGPELDVFEVLGDRPSILYASVHSLDPQASLEQPLVVPDTSIGFHTYGVDWGPQKIVFYMDGQAIATAATPADMNVPMYMLFNLAVGGASSWPGAPTAQTQFPANMRLDYVHAYQTSNTIGWTDPTPTAPAPLVLPAVQVAAAPGNSQAYVFVEHYGNQDSGTPLGGIGVALLNAAGQIIATGVTDTRGFHTFSGLAAGDYSIKYIMPEAYSIRPGNLADPTTGMTNSFSLSANDNYGVPYQLVTSSAELAGTVQIDGASAANVTVRLLNATTGAVSITATDATGRFSFWVAAGQYTVNYAPPSNVIMAPNGVADSTSGMTPAIVLADGQAFQLVPEHFTSTSASASSTGLPPVSTDLTPTPNSTLPPSQTVLPSIVTPNSDAAPAGGIAVYRFFDRAAGTQFLTASAAERDTILATRPDLISEGVGLGAANGTDDGSNAVPVYRFFDTTSGTHFYTSSKSEHDELLVSRPDLVSEGTSFYEHQIAETGDAAVYRFFDSINGTHFYTSSETEHSTILTTRPDLIAEGVSFYAPKSA